VTLTREQITAIRHLLECARYGRDEAGNPFLNPAFVGITEESLRIVERLLADAEVDHVRREHPRLLVS
jgi:hypothetical protein